MGTLSGALLWRHVTISTYATWLPGDPRGWRSRAHRKHSGGDYRDPPPMGEHEGLHEHAKAITPTPVALSPEARALVGTALVHSLIKQHHEIIVIAVTANHAHFLAKLPMDIETTRELVGKAKSASSLAVKNLHPGRVWAGGGSYKPVRTRQHQSRVFAYIVAHVRQGGWVWTFRDAIPG